MSTTAPQTAAISIGRIPSAEHEITATMTPSTKATLLVGDLVGVRARSNDITRFDGEGFNGFTHIAALAVEGDGDHPEALTEIDTTHGFPDQVGLGQHDGFHQGAFMGGDLFQSQCQVGYQIQAFHAAGGRDAGGAT